MKVHSELDMTLSELNVELFLLRRNHLDSLKKLRQHILAALQNKKNDQDLQKKLIALDERIDHEHLTLVQLYGNELGVTYVKKDTPQALQ